jgi:hypothetical protein
LFRCSFQLNNKQSILSPASAGPISPRRNYFGLYILYPFSKISKLFLAALQVTEITASLASQPSRQNDRTNEPLTLHTTTTTTTTTTGESTRQQHSGNNKGNTTPVVRTRMCRAYSTSPNLPRSGTLPNPNQSAARYSMYETNSYGQTYSRPAGGTAPACYPLKSLIPTSVL